MAPNGSLVVSADDSGLLIFWDFRTGNLQRLFEVDTLSSAAMEMQFTPDGRQLLILCRAERGLRMLDVANLEQQFESLGVHWDQ